MARIMTPPAHFGPTRSGPATLTLDFFHDAVCGWCFNISPRLRKLAAEFDLDVRHHAYVLQDSPERMEEVWGSPAQAKARILEHWAACQAASDAPELFSIEAMRRAPFDYPHGLPAALACKAAERLGAQEDQGAQAGQAAHWDMFDRLQAAHLSDARNIADPDVLRSIARDLGIDGAGFDRAMQSPETREAVEQDRNLARRLQVASVPTIIVRETGARLVNGPIEDLRAQLFVSLRLVA